MARKFVVVDTAARRLALRALANRLDAAMGYPKLGVNADTGETVLPPPGRPNAEAYGVTLEHADIRTHPSLAGMRAWLVDDVSRPYVAAILQAIRNRVLAGTADATELAIDGLPVEGDIDASWEPAAP